MNEQNYYKEIRRLIVHEDHLIHDRLSWLLALQGFLFTALGFSLSSEAIAGENVSKIHLLFHVRIALAVVGSGSSILTWISITSAAIAIGKLRKAWKIFCEERNIVNGFPPILGGASEGLGGGLVAAIILPLFLAAVWGYVSFNY